MGYNIVYINVDCCTFTVCLWPRSVFLFNEETCHFTILRCIKCAWQQNAFENSKTANLNIRYSVVAGYMSWAYILRLLRCSGLVFSTFLKYFKVRMRRFLGTICGTFTKMNPAACLNRAWLLRSICSFWWYRVRLHFGKTDSCKQAHFILWKVIDLRNRVQCDQFQLTAWILLNVVLFFLYVNDLIWYKK